MAAVIEHEPCYIYHVRDFQEHSQILEALSLNYGALAIVVNKSRRGNSSTQGIFQPFTPLKLSLKRSRGELFYLTDYDCSEPGYTFPLPQHFCAVYINELLCHLYRGKEQDVKLFGAYVSTLEAINNKQNIEQSLRLFELTLLESMGYALTLRDDEGILLDKDSYYRFCFGAGFFKVDPDAMNAVIAQEEAMKLGANHKTDLYERYTPISSSSAPNDDSGMLFPKSKVRGRRLEDSSSYYSYNRVDTSDAYISMVMRSGFADEEYLQRYQDLSRDFMGPVLTGEQIRDIVRCDFTLPDSIKLAKQLTGAIIERLLNGKEIASRRLYREYAQMRNAKIKARKEAALASSSQGSDATSKDAVSQTTPTQGAPVATPQSSAIDSQNHQTNAPNDALDSTGLTSSEPKKQLFFEAYPDKGNHTNETSKQDYPEFSRPEEIPYISQFDYVHNCVPRDKHDAPEFLCEYLNLGNHNQPISVPPVGHRAGASSVPSAAASPSTQQSTVGYSEPSLQPDNAALSMAAPTTEVAQMQEPAASQLSQTQCDSEHTDDAKETASKVENVSENNVGSVPQQQDVAEAQSETVTEPKQDTAKVSDSLDEDSVAGSKASSKPKTSETKATPKVKPKDEPAAPQQGVDEVAVSGKEAVSASKGSLKSKKSGTKVTSKAKPKTVTRSEVAKLKEADKKVLLKAKAEAKKEANKLKAAEKKAAQKAAMKAKAEAKKEAERQKAAAKKEALKLKAAEKKAAQKAALKAKAEAKKEAERLKAAAKKEAEKLKAAEKKAVQKAKSAALKAANKEKAKAKAKADAEAKEAQIDREFAHSMLAMLDTGMKRRQRQSKQNVLSDDER